MNYLDNYLDNYGDLMFSQRLINYPGFVNGYA